MQRPLGLLCLAAAALALALVPAIGAGGQASNGEVQAVNDAAITQDAMPRQLSDYGFFADMAAQRPQARVYPYRLNTPLWSDGADKLRFIYVPQGAQLSADGDGLLQFPLGTAIIKTFAYGTGANRQLIETRVLLLREDGWLALPYRWNEERSDARLALAGARIAITNPQGEQISYRIPNKNQCKSCHSIDDAVVPIGPKARNLDADWMEMLVGHGGLDQVPQGGDAMPVWDDEGSEASTSTLARSYLDVNCAHCHRPGGGASNSGLDLRWEQDDPFAIGVRKPPVAAGRGAGGLLVSIAPGEPDMSILVHRMNSTEPGVAMPELGRSTIDERAVSLMRDWVEGMEQ